MPYSLKQAADATGRTKPTLLRAIQTGKISAKKNEMREWEIDPAELHRVYPPVAQGVTSTVTSDEEVTVELLLLRQELAAKEERVTALQEERERERRQLTERITELREQLAQSETERREKDRQLTALLTDQRVKGEEESAYSKAINRWLSWLRTLR
jgi:septal ring factor EnvC (AmiA/AmiB activator)